MTMNLKVYLPVLILLFGVSGIQAQTSCTISPGKEECHVDRISVFSNLCRSCIFEVDLSQKSSLHVSSFFVADLRKHMLSGDVFLEGITLTMTEVSGSHQLLVSWKVAHPICMERICIQFPDNNIKDHCIRSTLSREAAIAGLPCNIYINVQLAVSAVGFLRILPAGRVYIGGKKSNSQLHTLLECRYYFFRQYCQVILNLSHQLHLPEHLHGKYMWILTALRWAGNL